MSPQHNYMADMTVSHCYAEWINSPTKSWLREPDDRELFFHFVKACSDYAENNKISKRLDTSWLKAHLFDSMEVIRLRDEDVYQKLEEEIILEFVTLLDYEDTVYPVT